MKIFVIILLVLFGIAFAYLWRVQHSSEADAFRKGTLPSPLPDGLYHGTVPGHTVSWQGKKFDASQQTGINLFKDGEGKQTEKYPFTTSAGKGVHEDSVDVIRIDYNIGGNPFWLRLILDEIVQTSPGHYLGKLNVRLPGYTATLGFFNLAKE